jgi:hypothetical protein
VFADPRGAGAIVFHAYEPAASVDTQAPKKRRRGPPPEPPRPIDISLEDRVKNDLPGKFMTRFRAAVEERRERDAAKPMRRRTR